MVTVILDPVEPEKTDHRRPSSSGRQTAEGGVGVSSTGITDRGPREVGSRRFENLIRVDPRVTDQGTSHETETRFPKVDVTSPRNPRARSGTGGRTG